MLQTFVPIWLAPDGAVVVAEMSQPLDPVTSTASGPWNTVALVSGVLLLGAIAMIVVTSTARASNVPVPVYDYGPRGPGSPARAQSARGGTVAPLIQQPDVREVEERRHVPKAALGPPSRTCGAFAYS